MAAAATTAGMIGGGEGSSNNSKSRRKQQIWYSQSQPLTPLMEGPDPDIQEEASYNNTKKTETRSWDLLRDWLKNKNSPPPPPPPTNFHHHFTSKRQDLKLLLGVLACPLAPIPLLDHHHSSLQTHLPIENSVADYIIQQYLAATGCLKKEEGKKKKNMYATGMVKMIGCETEVSSGNGKAVKTVGTRTNGENGCFVVWQMYPGMWSLELVVASTKVVAGSDGKTVWRHTPWLGTHAAKGPQRPLRRIIQGLDPKSTAMLFAKAQYLEEKRIGEDDCFVLKVSADREALMERNEGPAEVIRHVLYGYFCQKSGLLVYLEDSHLTRVVSSDDNNVDVDADADAVYWETTIGSCIGDYREVDGLLIAHQGRSIATVFKFGEGDVEGEMSSQFSRTRMEEVWNIDDVVFNVPGLCMDHFIPPADIYDNLLHSP